MKMCFPVCAPGPTGVPKATFLAHCGALLDGLGHPLYAATSFKRAQSALRHGPQERRMRQKDQPGTRNTATVDPRVA